MFGLVTFKFRQKKAAFKATFLGKQSKKFYILFILSLLFWISIIIPWAFSQEIALPFSVNFLASSKEILLLSG